jgi:orotidine-5'-phosphate decarboxylase
MVPGVRLPGASLDDQARVGTPAEIVAEGGDWLVVGRTVTAADDRDAAVAAVVESVREGLAQTTASG